jgi:hypothetical protein
MLFIGGFFLKQQIAPMILGMGAICSKHQGNRFCWKTLAS